MMMTSETPSSTPASPLVTSDFTGSDEGQQPSSRLDSRSYIWFAARTAPSQETVAAALLARAGFATFLPTAVKFRWGTRVNRARRQKVAIEYPLMPGYVFFGMGAGTPGWGAVLYTSTTGRSGRPIAHRRKPVIGIISHEDGRPYAIPHRNIRDLMWRHAGGKFDAPTRERWMQTYAEFAEGDLVQTEDELWKGRVISFRDSRATILVSLLGADREVEVDVASLLKIE